MRTLTLPGYWYCDALPNGSYCTAQFGSDLVNRNGDIFFPPYGLIWLTINPTNGYDFAGSDQNNNHARELINDIWIDRGINEGLHATLYKNDGSLIVVKTTQGNPPTGALGWRYIDDNGEPIKTVDTYTPESPLGIQYEIKNLWEYTIRSSGNLVVGQGEFKTEAIIDGK